MIKDVSFTNSRNEKIQGVLKEKKSSDVLILACHGLNDSKKHPTSESITNKLYDNGYTTLSIDFSQSAQGFNLEQQILDIRDTIAHYNNYKKVVIMAVSLGATAATIASSQLPKISGLVTLNGFFGSAQLGTKVIKTYLMFRLFAFLKIKYHDNWQFFKENFKPENIACPVLVIHANADEEVFVSQSKNFFKKLSGEKELYILKKGSHHLLKETDRQEVANIIDVWLRSNFQ